MRKLILTSIKFKVGDTLNDEDRLVVIECSPDDSDEKNKIDACYAVQREFSKYYSKEAVLFAVGAKPTIDGTHPPDTLSKPELYTREQLVSFGNFMLSKFPDTKDRLVGHNDVENWIVSDTWRRELVK